MKAIISVIGTHAGCSISEIISRKQQDITQNNYALWTVCSFNSVPFIAQSFFSKEDQIPLYLISASGASKNNPLGNSKPTKLKQVARYFSTDKISWIEIPQSMYVTGSLSHMSVHALFIKELQNCEREEEIDLRYWAGIDQNISIRFGQGASTSCAVRLTAPIQSMKSYSRKIIAKGKLIYPFSVYLK